MTPADADGANRRLQQLIDRFRAGAMTAPDLLDQLYPVLTGIARKTLHSNFPRLQGSHNTASIANRTCVRLLEEIDPRRVTKPGLGTWLMELHRLPAVFKTRVWQVCCDLCRRRARQDRAVHCCSPDLLDQYEAREEGPADLALAAELLHTLEEVCRHQLTPEELAVFTLCFSEGMSRHEAAVALGLPDKTASRLWLAARAKLADALGLQLETHPQSDGTRARPRKREVVVLPLNDLD